MAEDKEGMLVESQVIKCPGSHDEKFSVLPGGIKKLQGDSLGPSFIWMVETETHSLMLLLFQCSSEKERDRWAFSFRRPRL